MKRMACIAMVLLALLLAGAAALAESDTTLLVYMCGGSLQDAGCIDLYEMAEANTGAGTNILVMAGGASAWDDEDLAGGTRNLVVISGGDFAEVTDAGRGSMGDPECLLEFLEYGLTEYPADRTIVVLWNHGAGSEGGVCFDETEGDDGLTLNEINDALYQLDDDLPGYHINVFGCDACMMATYEMASLLSHYSIDYFIASEEIEPGIGWYYTPWLKALERDPGMSNEALCGLIVDSYMDDNAVYSSGDPYGLSAVNLDALPALNDAMEDFAASMTAAIQRGGLADVRRGRSRIYTFGSYCDGSWDMVDMSDVLDAYTGFNPAKAAEARRALDRAIVCNRRSDNMAPCCGLSMMLPQDTCDDYGEYRDGFDLSFYLPNWVNFVDTYVDLLNESDYSFGELTPTQVNSGDTISGENGSLWDIDWYDLFGGSESYTVSDGDYGFSIQLTNQDMENLDYVEGMLLADASDDEITAYVDLGAMRNNRIDWQTGEVYSLFDGSWPTFGDQLVPLYDQSVNERCRRSLLPVKLNGEHTYLVVLFDGDSAEGRVIGANAGYDDSGLPIRTTEKLRDGDTIVPVYTMYYQDADADDDADFEEQEFDGDPITWREGMTVSYISFTDGDRGDDEPMTMLFCFVINDIFGDSELSDFIDFEI